VLYDILESCENPLFSDVDGNQKNDSLCIESHLIESDIHCGKYWYTWCFMNRLSSFSAV